MGEHTLMKAHQADHKSAKGHSQCMPTHATMSQNTGNPCLNYNCTMTPYIYCLNVPQIHHTITMPCIDFNIWACVDSKTQHVHYNSQHVIV